MSAQGEALSRSSNEGHRQVRAVGRVPLIGNRHGLGVEVVQGQLILERRNYAVRFEVERDGVRPVVQLKGARAARVPSTRVEPQEPFIRRAVVRRRSIEVDRLEGRWTADEP